MSKFSMGDQVIVTDVSRPPQVGGLRKGPHHGKSGTIASARPDRHGWWRVTGIRGATHFQEDQLRKV
jgi:hypothetical protein